MTTIATAAAGPATGPATCTEYRSHAFVQNKCRDCGRPPSDHPNGGVDENAATSTHEVNTTTVARRMSLNSTNTSNGGGVHAHAFDDPVEGATAVSMLAQSCTHYRPHAWVYDRCRDCGGNESKHATSEATSGDHAADGSGVTTRPKAGSLLVRHSGQFKSDSATGSGRPSIETRPLELRDAKDISALQPSSTKSQGKSEASYTDGVLSPSQSQSQESAAAEARMTNVMAKLRFFEQKLETLRASDALKLQQKEITQAEYDRRIAELEAAFARKEKELRAEVDAARAAIEEAQLARQREIEANAERRIAEAQEEARRAVEAAEAEKREAMSAAERERMEAAQLKSEIEQLKAQQQQQTTPDTMTASTTDGALTSEALERNFTEHGGVIVMPNDGSVLRELDLGDETDEQPAEPQPTSPMHDTVVGREGAVQLSEVLKNVEKLFQHGRNVVRFRADPHPPTFSSIFIRELQLDAASRNADGIDGATTMPKTHYSLCWSKANDRRVHRTRILDFNDIHAIVLGKQTSVMKQASAASAPNSCCVSFIARGASAKKSLHLLFGNERDAETWCYGVASLIKEYDPSRKPTVYERNGSYYEQDAERKKDFDSTIDVEEDSGAKEVTTAADLTAVLTTAQPAKYKVEFTVKASNLPSVHHNTIVCLVDRNERTNKLEYLSQTERITTTNSPAFRKRFQYLYYTSSAKTLRLNVYDVPVGSKTMEDSYRIGSCIVALADLTAKPGADFVYPLAHRNPTKQAALNLAGSTLAVTCVLKEKVSTPTSDDSVPSVANSTVPPMASSTMGQSTMVPQQQQPMLPVESEEDVRLARAKLQEGLRMMIKADTFINHVEGLGAQTITMFYSEGQPSTSLSNAARAAGIALDPEDRFDLGSFHWAAIGAKAQTMPLRTIVDIFVGCKSAVFPPTSLEEHCFSIVAKTGVRLDLEAKSKEQRDAWTNAIIACLKAAALQNRKDKAFLASITQPVNPQAQGLGPSSSTTAPMTAAPSSIPADLQQAQPQTYDPSHDPNSQSLQQPMSNLSIQPQQL